MNIIKWLDKVFGDYTKYEPTRVYEVDLNKYLEFPPFEIHLETLLYVGESDLSKRDREAYKKYCLEYDIAFNKKQEEKAAEVNRIINSVRIKQ